MMTKQTIFLVDDHQVVRDGLSLLLAQVSDFEVIGRVGDGEEALRLIPEKKPAVAIIDISMPGMGGLELIRRLKEMGVTSKLLVLTAYFDLGYLRQLLRMGINGYLLKRSAADDLILAIRAVVEGQRYLDKNIVDGLVSTLADTDFDPAIVAKPNLSEREKYTVIMIAKGFTNKEIAAQLDISIKSIETYKSRSMSKLGLRGRADLVRFVNSQGWLTDDTQ